MTENQKKQPGFEEGMAELEAIVGRLEDRNITLEESLVAFERGHALHKQLTGILKSAEMRIEKMSASDAEAAPANGDDATENDIPF